MTTSAGRTFIAAMHVTIDGYSVDRDGQADWVDSWADALGLLPEVDAFVLGAGMFTDYEGFWTAVLENPAAVTEWLGREPYPRELEYARRAVETPHLVLSRTLGRTNWPTARIVRDLDALREFKAESAGAVYVVGGPSLLRALLDGDLIDELRLIVHPVLLGGGSGLSEGLSHRQNLELVSSEPAAGGCVSLTYRIARDASSHAG